MLASRVRLARGCVLVLGLVLSTGAAGVEPELRLYLDADMSGNLDSGASLEHGIRTALHAAGDRLGGKSVELVVLDHHGNTHRSRRHLEQYVRDDRALAVFCGMHSPPVLTNLEYIHQNEILLLDPWAAAGPITRFPASPNWVFRLSVDDRKAGEFFVRYAIQQRGFKRPALLLETTAWGRANEVTMKQALQAVKASALPTTWFDWGLGEEAARIMLRSIANSGADVIFLVSNAPEGKTFARAMAGLAEADRRPICSHWGITGGDFYAAVGPEVRARISLRFLQTRFTFFDLEDRAFAAGVLADAKARFPEQIRGPQDVKAPAGFAHAYDLTRLLAAAIGQVTLTGEIKTDRRNVRIALEQLREPVQGLLKTYRQPFAPYDEDHPDAHEALGLDDLVMANYGEHGEIRLEKSPEGQP